MNYSEKLASLIKGIDFSPFHATVVGYGGMGKEYVKGLKALGVQEILVCSRSEGRLKGLEGVPGISIVSGGYQNLRTKPGSKDVAIVATQTEYLLGALRWLVEIGYQNLLVEKPVSLWSEEIRQFESQVAPKNIKIFSAYNRLAYPAVYEVRKRSEKEGGITSCHYNFTEFVNRMKKGDYPDIEMERWGISNSLHVMSMAHALIGLPQEWKSYQIGSSVSWHPAGNLFVGTGISEKNIPFSYHADWGSKGRWLVEVHTQEATYRFCPLEKLFRKTDSLGDFEEIPLASFSQETKVGFVEQLAAALNEKVRKEIPLMNLKDTLALTQFGEAVFAYSKECKHEG